MAPVPGQGLDQGDRVFGRQGEKEGVDEAAHEQEHQLVSPRPDPCAFHGQVGIAGAVVDRDVTSESSQSGGGRPDQHASLTTLN